MKATIKFNGKEYDAVLIEKKSKSKRWKPEIKFRAWDYTSNVMRNDITEMVFNSDGILNQINVETGADILFPEKECVLMQYTGLKDKNGVEIYRGDIVYQSPDDIAAYKRVVEYEGHGFRLSGLASFLQQEVDWTKQVEVIGNIYENPDLLEANQ